MEVTRTELQQHAKQINAVLQEACDARDPAPLVRLIDSRIALATYCPDTLSRKVTTDMGLVEIALRLPIPDARHPRFWIAMQEEWKWKSKHRVRFLECGLRLYVGDRSEEAVQFLRLEWVAPTDDNGVKHYHGKHAGHPHWHVDRSALVGQEASFRSLEILTAPALAPQAAGEEFSGSALVGTPAQPLLDFSWLQKMHLPARAQWMQSEWDGRQIPGPHQCEPISLDELTHWWAGALRYFSAELPR